MTTWPACLLTFVKFPLHPRHPMNFTIPRFDDSDYSFPFNMHESFYFPPFYFMCLLCDYVMCVKEYVFFFFFFFLALFLYPTYPPTY